MTSCALAGKSSDMLPVAPVAGSTGSSCPPEKVMYTEPAYVKKYVMSACVRGAGKATSTPAPTWPPEVPFSAMNTVKSWFTGSPPIWRAANV